MHDFQIYPSWPKSSVNFCSFFISSSLTVGFVRDNEFNMSPIVTGGSYNLEPSTSIQVISMAPASPGEQGTSKSSTICVLSDGQGPRTVWNFQEI